jgi:hypothetical protein
MQHCIKLNVFDLTNLLKEVILKNHPDFTACSVSFEFGYADDRYGSTQQVFTGVTISCDTKKQLDGKL